MHFGPAHWTLLKEIMVNFFLTSPVFRTLKQSDLFETTLGLIIFFMCFGIVVFFGYLFWYALFSEEVGFNYANTTWMNALWMTSVTLWFSLSMIFGLGLFSIYLIIFQRAETPYEYERVSRRRFIVGIILSFYILYVVVIVIELIETVVTSPVPLIDTHNAVICEGLLDIAVIMLLWLWFILNPRPKPEPLMIYRPVNPIQHAKTTLSPHLVSLSANAPAGNPVSNCSEQATAPINDTQECLETYTIEVPDDMMRFTERVMIRSSDELKKVCTLSKNLYNAANYVLRQHWFHTGRKTLVGNRNVRHCYLGYESLYQLIKDVKDLMKEQGKSKTEAIQSVVAQNLYLTDDMLDSLIAAYETLPAQTSQQNLRLLCKSWEGFLALEKDVRENPSKYVPKFKARPPGYKRKDDEWIVIFTNQGTTMHVSKEPKSPKLAGPGSIGFIHFVNSAIPPVKVRTDIFAAHYHYAKQKKPKHQIYFDQVRVLPRGQKYIIEIVYLKQIKPAETDPDAILSIDVGVTNLITAVTNRGTRPIIIRGREVKSINQWYNKQRAYYQSVRDLAGKRLLRERDAIDLIRKHKSVSAAVSGLDTRIAQESDAGKLKNLNLIRTEVLKFGSATEKDLYTRRKEINRLMYAESSRLRRITLDRKKKIEDLFHKTSRFLITYCIENGIGTIVIGHNEYWKQEVQIGSKNTQNFVFIPFNRLIEMIRYKATQAGIQTEIIEEAHTSKCSAIDGEAIGHHDRYVGTRITRGLFRAAAINPTTGKNYVINADVNGAFNILRRFNEHAARTITIADMLQRPQIAEIR